MGGSAGNAASVDAAQIFCSFLPGQLSDEEFDEPPLPLDVHDPGFASNGSQAARKCACSYGSTTEKQGLSRVSSGSPSPGGGEVARE